MSLAWESGSGHLCIQQIPFWLGGPSGGQLQHILVSGDNLPKLILERKYQALFQLSVKLIVFGPESSGG
jgi:hypothetical protein